VITKLSRKRLSNILIGNDNKSLLNVANFHLVWRNDPDFSISLLSPTVQFNVEKDGIENFE